MGVAKYWFVCIKSVNVAVGHDVRSLHPIVNLVFLLYNGHAKRS